MPAMRAMNCRLSTFPLFARTAGTSRYSFRRSGETKIMSSATAFRTASLGVPPKAKAETSTPVSMTSLFLCRVGFSPDRLDGVLDVLHRQAGSFKGRLGHAEGRIKTFLRRATFHLLIPIVLSPKRPTVSFLYGFTARVGRDEYWAWSYVAPRAGA